MKIAIGIFSFFIFWGVSWVQATELYVKSIKAPVYTSADVGSVKIAELNQGDKMDLLEETASWQKISFGNQTGWIIKFLTDINPPINESSIYGKYQSLEGKYKAFADKARRRPSSYASAAAARGLREKRQDFSAQHRLDYKALEKIEAIDITDDQARLFLEKGIQNEQSK